MEIFDTLNGFGLHKKIKRIFFAAEIVASLSTFPIMLGTFLC
jgi:hypothetical protein